jgi:hypothetical protein
MPSEGLKITARSEVVVARRFTLKMRTLLAAWMCYLFVRAAPWTISCQECVTAVDAARSEWQKLEPAMIRDLPTTLCRDCTLPAVCEQGITSLVEALNESIAVTTGHHFCTELGLCNASTPTLWV